MFFIKYKLIEFLMKEDIHKINALHFASANDHEKIVNRLLNDFVFDKEHGKLIEFVMKEDLNKKTALHDASRKGNQGIVNSLLNVFNKEENDKLIEFLMKEEEKCKSTALHEASLRSYNQSGHEKVVNRLLNVFNEEEHDKLIEFVMKEMEFKRTSLHLASRTAGKEKIDKLIEFLMKKDVSEKTALQVASAYESHKKQKIIKLLENQALLCNLNKITQIFKKQINKDKKKPLWYLFDDNCCRLGKETILKFLIADYSGDKIHII